MNPQQSFFGSIALVTLGFGMAAVVAVVTLAGGMVSMRDVLFVWAAFLLPALPCSLLCAWWFGARRMQSPVVASRSAFVMALRITLSTFLLYGVLIVWAVTPAAIRVDQEWLPLVSNPWALLAAWPIFVYALIFAFAPALFAGWAICTSSLKSLRIEGVPSS